MTIPVAGTMSIGLPAFAQLSFLALTCEASSVVFAALPRHFYRDGTTHGRLPGFSDLDNFIVTGRYEVIPGPTYK